MKKGYVINNNLDIIPANYQMVYAVGITGKERDPLFMKYWNDTFPEKRGIIHRPVLAPTVNEYDNASAFKWLLDELGYSNWNNGNPLIVDIWEATGDTRFNMDHVRVYGNYITEHFQPKVKPLLRLNIATWDSYLKNNHQHNKKTCYSGKDCKIKSSAWLVTELECFGENQHNSKDNNWYYYKEYDFNFIANDETCLWLQSPNPAPAPVEPEPSQPPEDEDPITLPVEMTVDIQLPKKWRISLFGGLIKGTIEAVEE